MLLQVNSVFSERNLLKAEHVTNSAYFDFESWRIIESQSKSHNHRGLT